MHGNLWEWCEDRAQKDYYKESPRTDPPGPSAGNGRLLRGGSWHDPPANCRSARRGLTVASPRFATHGFRIMVVCDDASASARVEKPARADFAPLAFATNLPREAALDLGGGVKMGLVLVPAGEFMMGAPRKRQWEGQGNEAPLHRVTITKPFYIGKYEVTVAQFAAFVGATKYQTYCEKPGNKGGGIRNGKWAEWPGINWRNPGFEQTPEHPVVLVSWNDAQAFVAWLSKQAGREVRLPTEAQWEYAARGPKSLEYPFGNKWDGLRVNHADAALKNSGWQFGGCSNDNDGYAYTAPVGKFNNASWCGAFDMVGNVGEVVQDWEADYPAEAQVDPQGAATGQLRVKRSSNWADHAETPASYRERKPVDGGSATNGFRVMVVALESPTATTSPPQATRTWTDSTGKHRMEATLLDFDGKVVRLKRPDGKIVTVPLEKLSETDRKHVRPQTRD
jgi:formylglycine-generating enzyme required for sulfatase activity